ncbi:hypothetical protein CEXT_540661 [Caerostris extrusa]|uniref:Uncharacterized protein n=1 Tax=Caerostris extrusa TaxID=172846 RepID=A0AAV4XLR2_CAEEX|nr:hypothetical protein CEXT_540661 [Caerostris extrusa]
MHLNVPPMLRGKSLWRRHLFAAILEDVEPSRFSRTVQSISSVEYQLTPEILQCQEDFARDCNEDSRYLQCQDFAI